MDKLALASYIDHTLLKPTATSEDIKRLCQEGNKYHFASICVNGSNVALAVAHSQIPVAAVVGFPLGAMSTKAKVAETEQVIADGASEIDMVINLGWAKAGAWEQVEEEIRQVVVAANGHLVKVIIETCYLTDPEKESACLAAKRAGAHFVKTSTGFGGGGATVADVELMRRTVGTDLGVKASGGVRDLSTAMALIRAGATRLGASAGVQIMAELEDSRGNQ
ncbi:MAG TPA: deoxyribose-phosphate aldolase [Firmicutes bacterium]|jgi:deoxyribose-phosphate aldolase|nr:deoxyribose-phosphate aldolase [Bacillota bacterium]